MCNNDDRNQHGGEIVAIEVFNRFEHKYLLDRDTYEKVLPIIEERMNIDSHNKDGHSYAISNIYYDTDDDFLIRNSLSKPAYKEKLRLRSYGTADMDSKVFLEIKKKYKGIVNKRRTVLTLKEAYEFTSTGIPPEIKPYMNYQVIKELEYFLKLYKPVPKLSLSYDRMAFFDRENSDLRISFDMNIRSRRYNLGLEKGDYGTRLLSEDVYLMEIKTSLAKPLWLCEMLTEFNIKRQSFSKYGTEFKQMINAEKLQNVI